MTGQVVIREAPLPVEIDAYIQGSVDEIIKDEGVVIKVKAPSFKEFLELAVKVEAR